MYSEKRARAHTHAPSGRPAHSGERGTPVTTARKAFELPSFGDVTSGSADVTDAIANDSNSIFIAVEQLLKQGDCRKICETADDEE